jgi:hypothetical protein
MTAVSPAAGALAYEMAVVILYLDLPETLVNVNASDRRQAHRWFECNVPLWVVETALTLGSLRRLMRPAEAPPLAPIRSLAYFAPVVEELLLAPVPEGYRAYLQARLRPHLRSPSGAPPG